MRIEPRNLDSVLSEIFHGSQAANSGVEARSKYTALFRVPR